MSRKSLFKDRVRHDLDLVLTARGAHGIAHYSFKDDTFTLKAGSKFIGVPTPSLINYGYSRTLDSYDYLVENGILVDDVLKQDLIFKNHNLGAMATLVSMAPVYRDGVKLANSNISFKSAITNPSLYNKYIAHCEYYDSNWNILSCGKLEKTQDDPEHIKLQDGVKDDSDQTNISSVDFGEAKMSSNSIFFRRAKHNIKISLLARGANGEVVYNHTEKKFILKKGSKLASRPSKVFCSGRYDRYLEARKSMESSGCIVDNISQRDLVFSGFFGLNSIVSLTPAYEDGAYLSGTDLNIITVLNNPSLYNKYIAHCEYYDENWNVIHSEANLDIDDTDIDISIEQENTSFDFETQDEPKPKEVEANLSMVRDIENSCGVTDLSSFSTIEIINEILVRLLK